MQTQKYNFAIKPIGQKKAQLNSLVTNVVVLTVAIIVFVLGLVLVQKLRDTQTSGTEAYVGANKSLTGFDDFADFIPIIVLAVSVSLILGIILTSFALRRRQR